MKITPIGNNIQLEINEASAGVLDTSSRETAVEYARVIGIGGLTMGKSELKVGDHVFVKAWAIDIINHEEKKYYFCNVDTGGILAVVK